MMSAWATRSLDVSNGPLCIDVRTDRVHWARRRRGRIEAGSFRLDESEPLGAAIAASVPEPDVRGYERAVSGAGAMLERSELPGLSTRDARRVGARRAEQLADELDDDVNAAFGLEASRAGQVLWVMAAPTSELEAISTQCAEELGVPRRIQHRHIAIARLAALLPKAAPGTLTAIVELEPETGFCVVVDEHGWLFSREIALRFMGERHLSAAAQANRDAEEGLLLYDEVKPDEAEFESSTQLDPLEEVALHTERLGTELRRTFLYVEGMPGHGAVGQLFLCGELAEQIDLRASLEQELRLPTAFVPHPAAASSAEAGGDAGVGAAAVAVGLALRADRRSGNLLPEAFALKHWRADWRRRLQRAALVCIALLAGSLFSAWSEHRELVDRAANAEAVWRRTAAQSGQMALLVEGAHRAEEVDRLLAQFSEPLPETTGVLRTLAHALPHAAALNSITIGRADTSSETDGEGEAAWRAVLEVDARAEAIGPAAAAVSDLARDLGASPLLRVGDVAQGTGLPRRQEAEEQLREYRFSIEASLVPVRPPGAEVSR